MLRLTSVAEAYGEDVWSWRLGAGVKSAGWRSDLRSDAAPAMVARKPITRESAL